MYEPNEEHRDWARSQMTEANYPQAIKTAVERLLEVWWRQNHTPETEETTLNVFDILARGHALVAPVAENERWVEAKLGRIGPRDYVRVKANAYRDEVGMVHNLRRGRVIGIRYGDIIVKYEDGKHPPFDAVHHSPHSLEIRV